MGIADSTSATVKNWRKNKKEFRVGMLMCITDICLLIELLKSDLGKVSRQILQRVNQGIRDKTSYNQWTSTSAYRVDRPTINQAEASVFPSFFSQLKDWLFFCLNFPSLGLRKITAYHSEHFGLENFTSVFQK